MWAVRKQSSRWLVPIAIIFVFLSTSILSSQRVSYAAAPTGYVVPLYTYPTDGTWTTLISEADANPTVPIVAIINPDSGPGAAPDANYVNGIENLRAAGITVLGYVWTCYGTRTLTGPGTITNPNCGVQGDYSTGAEDDINSYHSWYNVNGIFLDQMNSAPGGASYYSTLTSYANSLGYTTWGNPGTSVPSSYIGSVDVLNIYENSGLPSTTALAAATSNGVGSDFSMIAYNVPGSDLSQSVISDFSHYVNWISITDANLPNPYDVLPTYLKSLITYLASTTTSSESTNGITGAGGVNAGESGVQSACQSYCVSTTTSQATTSPGAAKTVEFATSMVVGEIFAHVYLFFTALAVALLITAAEVIYVQKW